MALFEQRCRDEGVPPEKKFAQLVKRFLTSPTPRPRAKRPSLAKGGAK